MPRRRALRQAPRPWLRSSGAAGRLRAGRDRRLGRRGPGMVCIECLPGLGPRGGGSRWSAGRPRKVRAGGPGARSRVHAPARPQRSQQPPCEEARRARRVRCYTLRGRRRARRPGSSPPPLTGRDRRAATPLLPLTTRPHRAVPSVLAAPRLPNPSSRATGDVHVDSIPNSRRSSVRRRRKSWPRAA
jgi:hypothetical protein